MTMRFLPVNLNAVLVELDDLPQTLALLASLQAEPIVGIEQLVPAARTLLVTFRPAALRADELVRRIGQRSLDGLAAKATRRIEIPVRYIGEDLAEVAGLLGIAPEEVVRRHTGSDYTVAFTGFAPGFAYLAGGDPSLDVPRRSVPRTRIPAGAVGLAGRFSGVYPQASPGGWQIIGITSTPMWDLAREVPALLQPGDTVRFVDVTAMPVSVDAVAEVRPALASSSPVPMPGGATLEIRSTGLQALWQDLGRHGMAGQGVSASGAMDVGALQAANRLVGNASDAACIEAVAGGLQLVCHGDAVVAVTGADGPLTLTRADGVRWPLSRYQPVALADGDTLSLGEPTAGLRSYLAVRGGFDTAPVLGSFATDTLSQVGPPVLQAGDVFAVRPVVAGAVVGSPEAAPTDLPTLQDEVVLDVVLGPRTDWFTDDAVELLCGQPWQVTPQSNRVGLRLAGEQPLARANPAELPSEGTTRGSIQVPPSGQPVLFMADHPLTGGYPVIGAVALHHLDRAGQIPVNARIRFRAVAGFEPSNSESPPMKKVLIANRGEIAVRIARACADYGVASVAVYADADLNALHARSTDEAYGLDGDRPADTYLNIPKLLAIAKRSGADAVHPGYGFLSESAAFAQAVIDAGLIWVGPTPAAIARLGDKVEARKIAMKVGAPLVAGTPGPVRDAQEVLAFAEQHGLPIAIKAAFGGGGRGIKVVHRLDEVVGLYESAVREAVTAFGRGECYVEQFLDRPRHVEAQVLADTHGHVVVLGTRDCSLQRRNQKLVEEAPAPFLSDAQRERIHQSARDICAEAGYTGAGTVEFLLSAGGAISFLEVNTRLQVEHPVTEETTGIDLVVEQLRIADGLPLSFTQTPVPRGHAFEFRINAEDVGRGFLPSPGHVKVFDAPSGPGVRVDTGVVSGSTVPGSFDSLMAKLIVTGATRAQAVARARRALREFNIEGVASVLPFHRAVMAHADFIGDDVFKVHTRWIETDFANDVAAAPRPEPLQETALHRTAIELDGRRMSLGLPAELLRGLASASVGDVATTQAGDPSADAATVSAPVSGTLQGWKVADGDEVAAGSVIAVMEAMKMEMQVLAHRAGRIALSAKPGGYLAAGTAIATIG